MTRARTQACLALSSGPPTTCAEEAPDHPPLTPQGRWAACSSSARRDVSPSRASPPSLSRAVLARRSTTHANAHTTHLCTTTDAHARRARAARAPAPALLGAFWQIRDVGPRASRRTESRSRQSRPVRAQPALPATRRNLSCSRLPRVRLCVRLRLRARARAEGRLAHAPPLSGADSSVSFGALKAKVEALHASLQWALQHIGQ